MDKKSEYDKYVFYLKNNKIIAIILIACAVILFIFTLIAAYNDAFPEDKNVSSENNEIALPESFPISINHENNVNEPEDREYREVKKSGNEDAQKMKVVELSLELPRHTYGYNSIIIDNREVGANLTSTLYNPRINLDTDSHILQVVTNTGDTCKLRLPKSWHTNLPTHNRIPLNCVNLPK